MRALALGAALAAAVLPAATAERTARYAAPGCEVALEERATEPVLLLRPGCPLDLATSVRALAALLAELHPERRLDGVRALSLGRIEELPWLSERLSAAAQTAPSWDVRTGRARQGTAERAVADLLQAGALARELVEVLATFGAEAEIASVETVLVGGDAGDRVPRDAVVWLRLAPQ